MDASEPDGKGRPNQRALKRDAGWTEFLKGTEVYGPDRSNIGQIDHLMIDKLSGRVPTRSLAVSRRRGCGARFGRNHTPIEFLVAGSN